MVECPNCDGGLRDLGPYTTCGVCGGTGKITKAELATIQRIKRGRKTNG